MELHNYWPEFMAEMKEFKALALAEQPEVTVVQLVVRQIPDDFFVETLTDAGAERWEKMLGLAVAGDWALDDRRFRIMTWFTEQAPFTFRRLKELLGTLCGEGGFTATRDVSTRNLVVRVALTAKQNYKDVGALLERIVPANMTIDLSLLYNQHGLLAGFTHTQLSAYTHEQLRNEAIT
ncbi:conserved hypothetical protein [uncultured Eubacteriales bacterium]|uniref:DUF2313 domain-containing protein n=1 Tax=uncultured Eubacteriales bacterium TaxID=172733 RepID=A0A212J4Q1_9FIRM|nr:conserved hypothetical protein [uncultured Eubacteriales bacterium]